MYARDFPFDKLPPGFLFVHPVDGEKLCEQLKSIKALSALISGVITSTQGAIAGAESAAELFPLQDEEKVKSIRYQYAQAGNHYQGYHDDADRYYSPQANTVATLCHLGLCCQLVDFDYLCSRLLPFVTHSLDRSTLNKRQRHEVDCITSREFTDGEDSFRRDWGEDCIAAVVSKGKTFFTVKGRWKESLVWNSYTGEEYADGDLPSHIYGSPDNDGLPDPTLEARAFEILMGALDSACLQLSQRKDLPKKNRRNAIEKADGTRQIFYDFRNMQTLPTSLHFEDASIDNALLRSVFSQFVAVSEYCVPRKRQSPRKSSGSVRQSEGTSPASQSHSNMKWIRIKYDEGTKFALYFYKCRNVTNVFSVLRPFEIDFIMKHIGAVHATLEKSSDEDTVEFVEMFGKGVRAWEKGQTEKPKDAEKLLNPEDSKSPASETRSSRRPSAVGDRRTLATLPYVRLPTIFCPEIRDRIKNEYADVFHCCKVRNCRADHQNKTSVSQSVHLHGFLDKPPQRRSEKKHDSAKPSLRGGTSLGGFGTGKISVEQFGAGKISAGQSTTQTSAKLNDCDVVSGAFPNRDRNVSDNVCGSVARKENDTSFGSVVGKEGDTVCSSAVRKQDDIVCGSVDRNGGDKGEPEFVRKDEDRNLNLENVESAFETANDEAQQAQSYTNCSANLDNSFSTASSASPYFGQTPLSFGQPPWHLQSDATAVTFAAHPQIVGPQTMGSQIVGPQTIGAWPQHMAANAWQTQASMPSTMDFWQPPPGLERLLPETKCHEEACHKGHEAVPIRNAGYDAANDLNHFPHTSLNNQASFKNMLSTNVNSNHEKDNVNDSTEMSEEFQTLNLDKNKKKDQSLGKFFFKICRPHFADPKDALSKSEQIVANLDSQLQIWSVESLQTCMHLANVWGTSNLSERLQEIQYARLENAMGFGVLAECINRLFIDNELCCKRWNIVNARHATEQQGQQNIVNYSRSMEPQNIANSSRGVEPQNIMNSSKDMEQSEKISSKQVSNFNQEHESDFTKPRHVVNGNPESNGHVTHEEAQADTHLFYQ